MLKTYDTVIISPHLDDAVFSCGGLISERVAAGKTVLVLNIFTAFPANNAEGPVELSERRYTEEADAAQLLGFDSENLEQLDAVIREPAYQGPQRLFGDPIDADKEYLTDLQNLLATKLGNIQFSEIYLPLAVGWHVDHTLTFLATKNYLSQFKTFYYEDAPYCLWPHTLVHRLTELGVHLDHEDADHTLARRGFVAEWFGLSRCWAGLPPMVNFKPAIARPFANMVVSGFFVRLLKKHRNRTADKPLLLTPETVDISQFFDAKMEACYCYRSQIGEFYLSREDCESRYRQFSHGISRGANSAAVYERYWRASNN